MSDLAGVQYQIDLCEAFVKETKAMDSMLEQRKQTVKMLSDLYEAKRILQGNLAAALRK